MEEILFNSYRKYQKNNKRNTLKALFRLPIGARVLLAMSFICLVLNILVIFCDWIQAWGGSLLIS